MNVGRLTFFIAIVVLLLMKLVSYQLDHHGNQTILSDRDIEQRAIGLAYRDSIRMAYEKLDEDSSLKSVVQNDLSRYKVELAKVQEAASPRSAVAYSDTADVANSDQVVIWMRIVVSLLILGSALYVILSARYDDSVAKWAMGAVGLVVGFWLK